MLNQCAARQTESTHQLSLAILALVLRHENPLSREDSAAANGEHLRRIRAAVAAGQTLELVLPAFPAKSPNREKTLSALPDYAEVLGLMRLQKLCDQIGLVYRPGARVVICSDGRVFSDLVLVSDEEVSAYGRAIDRMIGELNLSSLSTLGMEDVFGNCGFDAMRALLISRHGRSLAEIRTDVLGHADALAMFNGIHRFVFEDRLVLFPEKSRNKLREESKAVAYQVIQRSNAWSGLVEALFPRALRLSIHPQVSRSAKIGFQLVDCENTWGTPWHNVALAGPQGIRLVKRKEAEALGARLELAHGKYAFYRLGEAL